MKKVDRLAKQLSMGLGVEKLAQNPFGVKDTVAEIEKAMKGRNKAGKARRGKGRQKQIAKAKALAERQKKIDKILATPRPKSPNIVGKAIKAKEDQLKKEAIRQAEEDLLKTIQDKMDADKLRLMDILGDYNQFLTNEDTDKMKAAIENASSEQLNEIWGLMPSEDWKDFYKMLSGYYSGIDKEDIESTLDQIAEILGLELTY